MFSLDRTQALPLSLVTELFDRSAKTAFYAKDASKRYVSSNQAMRDLCGVRREEDLIGRSAEDFFSKEISERNRAADEFVLTMGRPTTPYLSLFVPRSGRATWLANAQWPIHDIAGRVCGLAGVSNRFEKGERADRICRRVSEVVSIMRAQIHEPPSVQTLAARVGVSRAQLVRDFVMLFNMSPVAYFSEVRVEKAFDMLRRAVPVALVAQACGYSEQSAFARRFRQLTGLSPSAVYAGKHERRASER